MLVLLGAACSGDGKPPGTRSATASASGQLSSPGAVNTGAPGVPAPLPSGLDCAAVPPAGASWPEGVPPDLPQPPNATLGEVTRDPVGPLLVHFTTPGSLRDGVVFVLCTLPKAGYVLGRGDAELAESDTPFQKGAVHGLFRLTATEPGRVDWLLALQEDTSVPLPPGGSSGAPSTAPPTFG